MTRMMAGHRERIADWHPGNEQRQAKERQASERDDAWRQTREPGETRAAREATKTS